MSPDSLSAFFIRLSGGNSAVGLLLQLFLVVLAVVVANYLLRRTLHKLEDKTRTTPSPWDFALVSAARKPFSVLAWIVGLSFALRIIESEADATLFELVPPARTIGVIACLTWFLLRFIANVQDGIIEQRAARGESVDRTTVDAIGKLLRLSVLITAILVTLQSLGFSISGVLAFGGIGGIAVGFAARDLLANFFGGLMVYLDRPFEVGDWIRSPDKDIEGTVEEIGWRLTRVRTFDKRPLYVPNSVFTQISVENPSRMTNRRIFETVGVRYDDIDRVAAIVEDIRAMLRAHPDIDQAQTLIVNFTKFNDSSLDILVYTFTRTIVWVEFHAVKQDVMLKIAAIIQRHGAQVAFPTRTLHVPERVPVEMLGEPAAAGRV
jgi:MscS family membrane protein